MSTIDDLQASIKFDVDRLANLKRLEEEGLILEEPPADVVYVWVKLRKKHARASLEFHAVRDGSGWTFWQSRGGRNPVSVEHGWSQFQWRIQHEEGIIEAASYYGPEGLHFNFERPQ
jgi:hypothetical protein